MQISNLYLGATILYNHKLHRVMYIGKDKVGLVPTNIIHGTYYGYELNRDRNKIKFVRISLIEPIPISEVIPFDNRFKPSTIIIGKSKIEGLGWNGNNFSLFICKDSKFINVYRLFFNNKEYGIRYYDDEGNIIPIISCLPISYMHELVYLLRKHKLYINFSTNYG